MTSKTGIWIDHRQAILVELSSAGENVIHVHSEAEKQSRRSSDHPTGSFESLQVECENRHERKLAADLAHFYEEVLSHINVTNFLLILGPGEAKHELQKQLSSSSRVPEHVSVETADKMTEHQLVAKVREFFGVPAERSWNHQHENRS